MTLSDLSNLELKRDESAVEIHSFNSNMFLTYDNERSFTKLFPL